MKILIVEDEEPIRLLLSKILRENGFDVFEAKGGEDCLTIARQENPAVIVMDLVMPGMSGWEAIGKLKSDSETDSIPVLVMTGKGTPENIRRAMDAGARGVIVKSQFKLQAFVGSMREAATGAEGSGAFLPSESRKLSPDLASLFDLFGIPPPENPPAK